jgi:hypothetical protein
MSHPNTLSTIGRRVWPSSLLWLHAHARPKSLKACTGYPLKVNEQNGAKQDARSRNLCQAVFSMPGGRVQRDVCISDSSTGQHAPKTRTSTRKRWRVASRKVEESNLKSKRLRRLRRVRLLFRAKGLKVHDFSLARLLSWSITRIFARSPDSPTLELREIFDHIFPDISRDRHIFTDFQRLTQPLFRFTCVACSTTVSGPTVPASDRGRLTLWVLSMS